MTKTSGVHGEFCDHLEQIAKAVRRSFESGKPSLAQVLIGREANVYQ
ncbi:MAG: hypothetical protein IPF49_03450 [Gammaproteobacteria bacterium]|jgi:thiamine pyrophosphate-dependent acetolactate synthase large subunit-like protein|nr:hypothetical protein [Gammaproteobacteria bacterium]